MVFLWIARKAHLTRDDDFIAPSDSDEDLHERSSSRASSRRSGSSTDFEDGDRNEGKRKTSKSRVGRPSLKKTNTEGSSGGGNSLFLTAAEQRAQQQKTEKKAAEEPYAFLQDPTDVSNLPC